MVRNEQLIDPTASAVIGDSAPAPCHVGNQVLYNLAMIHSSEPLSSVRSYGINSAVARLGGISRLVSSRRATTTLVAVALWTVDRLYGSMPRSTRALFYDRQPERVILCGLGGKAPCIPMRDAAAA